VTVIPSIFPHANVAYAYICFIHYGMYVSTIISLTLAYAASVSHPGWVISRNIDPSDYNICENADMSTSDIFQDVLAHHPEMGSDASPYIFAPPQYTPQFTKKRNIIHQWFRILEHMPFYMRLNISIRYVKHCQSLLCRTAILALHVAIHPQS
jgi:hypothetical protein